MNIYTKSFYKSAHAFPDAAALIVQGNTYRYDELLEIVGSFRSALRERALVAGDAVAILASRSLTAYAAILACAAEGLTWVPLNPGFPDARNLRMLALSGARLMVVGDEALENAARMQQQIRNCVCLRGQDIEMDSRTSTQVRQPEMPQLDPALPAYLLFTSGSTGVPKGIPVAVHNLAAYLDNFAQLYPVPAGLRFTQMFDLTFDLSVHDLFVCWFSGGCLVVPTAQDLLMPLQFVRRHQINVWFSVPGMGSIAKQSGLLRAGVLPSLQYVFFCGEALPVTTAQAWLDAAPAALVANLYGPTEATIAITAFTLDRQRTDWQSLSVVPIGSAYPGQFACVIKNDGSVAMEAESGELWLAGDQLTEGYLADPEKTAAAFVERNLAGFAATRWYRTGDCAMQGGALGIQYLGRMDRQVKINGFRVELQEVEQVLRQLAGSERVAVLPWPQSADGLYTGIAGFVAGSAKAAAALLQELAQILPDYMQPGQIRLVDQLPVNTNGKVDYGVLKQWLADASGL